MSGYSVTVIFIQTLKFEYKLNCMSDVLDKKLHDAISGLNDKQKKAVLGMVKVFTQEQGKITDHWDDPDFVAEMNDRYNEYKSGSSKLIALEEVEKKARKIAQNLKSKKAS